MLQTQNRAIALADRLELQVERLYGRYLAGDLDKDTFVALAAGVVAAANATAVAVGDAGLSAELAIRLGVTVGALGLGPEPVELDADRIERSLRNVLDADVDDPTVDDLDESRRRRLAQAVRSEPLITVATAVQRGMKGRRDTVAGWVRQTDNDPCPKCLEWADGVVRSVDTPMKRHNGCACIQQPVIDERPGFVVLEGSAPRTEPTPAADRGWTMWEDSPIGQLISNLA